MVLADDLAPPVHVHMLYTYIVTYSVFYHAAWIHIHSYIWCVLSRSMVLADDLDGNGRLDLLVSTMNGNVYMFETPAVYHPLKTWPQQVHAW